MDTVANGKESDERSSKRAVLLEYLQCQTVHENKDHSRFLTDIVRTWHFAVQTNVESLYASVAAVLALLLKTISDLIEFRDIGNQICQYLLLDDQVKLFDKGLWAIQAKEYLISPCLRLLTEIVSFDGGHAARTVFRQRETTFNRLEVFLSMRRDAHGGDAESRRRPPIRNIALRYFYANLRLQTPAAKRTMLTQGKIVRAIFEDLSEDSPDILLELLDVLKKEVASDDALPEYVKGRVFNEGTLSRLAVLYHYVEVEYASEGRKSIGDSVHNFLLFLCTSPGHGVLNLKERDPSTVENTKFEAATKMNHVRRSDDTFPTRNQTMDRNSKLASFLQSLRPYASVLHSELMIAVFYRAPELVSDYFVKKKSFSFDPKATTTWIGYSSFLLAIMRLPLPESLGVLKVNGGIPPSSKALISGIMPLPLTQKIMTRCLNQSVNLIKFIAINILSTAFEKLGKALGTCRLTRKDSISKPNSSAWNGLASDLITEFLNRIPDIGHVIAQFRRCSKTNNFLQESFTRLLALYHEILPQTALGAKLDVSLTLSAMLQESLEEGGVRRLELDHLLEIAFHSPSMQWWHKSGILDPSLSSASNFVNREDGAITIYYASEAAGRT